MPLYSIRLEEDKVREIHELWTQRNRTPYTHGAIRTVLRRGLKLALDELRSEIEGKPTANKSTEKSGIKLPENVVILKNDQERDDVAALLSAMRSDPKFSVMMRNLMEYAHVEPDADSQTSADSSTEPTEEIEVTHKRKKRTG